MFSWGRTIPRGEEAPLLLVAVLALPLCFVLFVEPYRLAVWTFVLASVPLAAWLALRGDLLWPRSLVLLGAVLFVAGLLVSMLAQEQVRTSTLVAQVSRGLFLLWFMYLVALVPVIAGRWLGWLLFVLVVACGISAAVNAGMFLSGNPLAADEEVARDPVVLRLLVADALDPARGQLVDPGVGIRHQDRRVRRDHELRAVVLDELPHAREHRQLPLR